METKPFVIGAGLRGFEMRVFEKEQPTETQLARVQKDYSAIAQEPVTVESIGGVLYAFGSEIATLRLFRKMPNMRQGFSKNMGVFFFAVEVAA